MIETTIPKSNECESPVPGETRREFFVRPVYTVKSEEHAFELRVVMPGVAREDVNISLEDSRLTITGSPHRIVPATWKPLHQELSGDAFRLELRLHRDIDERAIAAKVENGILQLRLPLSEAAKPRLIEVK